MVNVSKLLRSQEIGVLAVDVLPQWVNHRTNLFGISPVPVELWRVNGHFELWMR